MKRFNITSLILSVIIGAVLVICFALITGDYYANSLFPTLAILSGFIITGFIIGIMSKEITITEPGIGSVIVAVVAYFVLPSLELRGLVEVSGSDWFLILLNGIVLTFVGAWLGEQLQHGTLDHKKRTDPGFDWIWIVVGTVLGVTLNLILVILLTLIIGANPSKFYIPFFLSLLLVGIVIGRYSPGVTIKEAGLAGLLIITVEFDLLRQTLYLEGIEIGYIIGGLVLGVIATWIGGFIGEKMQSSKETVEN